MLNVERYEKLTEELNRFFYSDNMDADNEYMARSTYEDILTLEAELLKQPKLPNNDKSRKFKY